jgi:hypothetical protein
MITAAEILRRKDYSKRMSGPLFGHFEVSSPHPASRHDGHNTCCWNPFIALNIPGQQKIVFIFLFCLHFPQHDSAASNAELIIKYRIPKSIRIEVLMYIFINRSHFCCCALISGRAYSGPNIVQLNNLKNKTLFCLLCDEMHSSWLEVLYFDVTLSITLILLPQIYITFHSLFIHCSLHYEMVLYSLPGRWTIAWQRKELLPRYFAFLNSFVIFLFSS